MTNISGSWVCTTHGHTDRQRKIATVASPIYIISFLIGSNWGVEGVAASYSAACVVMRHPAFVYALRDMPISPRDIWLLTIRPLVLGLPLVAVSLALSIFASLRPLESLMLKLTLLGATIVVGILIGWMPDPRKLRSLLMNRTSTSNSA